MHAAGMQVQQMARRQGVDGARPCVTRRRGPRSSLTAAALAVCLASLVLTPPAAGAADRPGAPGSIGASWNTTTPTSLDVTWTSPGGSYLEYQVMYRTDTGTVWDPDPAPVSVGWKSAAGTVTTLSRTIAGLDASVTYVIAVRARSRLTGLYGTWGISGLIEPSGTPDRPSGIASSARSATSLTIDWPKVSNATGGYDLRVAEHGSSPAWSTATTVKVAQPGDATVSQAVTSTQLSGYAVSKTYVAQVRSRSSASGTCGSGGVKCSRWVASGRLAQLDVSGLSAVKNRNGGDPSPVRTDRLDVDVTWDALPSSLSDVSYELQFSWRNGQPSRFYDGSTGRPSGWVQDWQWWSLCNDGDATNNPTGPQDTADVDGDGDTAECLDPYNRTPPYLEPVWAFGPPEWGSVVTVTDSANCTGSGNARTCSYTFADSTVSYLTDEVHIRAVVGTGQNVQYGPRTYFTTSPVRAPGRPYGLSVSAPTGSSVKLVWSVPYDRGSEITGYDLQLVDAATGLASETVTGTKGTPAPPIPGDGSTRLSYTFSGVTSNKTYTVSVRAVNAEGSGSWRTSGNLALTAMVPGAPLLSVAPGGKGSGKLTLTAELENTGGATVTSWKRRLKTGNTYGAWTTIPSASGSALSAVVSNLTNGTSYTYQVQACNSAGCGTESNDATSTPANVPSAVTSPAAGSGRNGYVYLAGTATDNGSAITHWEYQYKQTSSGGAYSAWSSDWTVDHTSSTTPGSLDARVGGLTNGTSYSFRIRAVNIGGPGPQSTELTATPAQRTKPKVNLTLTPSSVAEGGTATVTAAFPWGFTSTHATTVTVAVAPTSPATASDYTLSSNVTLTIPAYTEAGTGTVTIAAVDDSLDEDSETLTVSATVANSSTQGVTAPDSQTLTITDDDTAAIVLSKTSVGITEGADATYTVKLGSQPTHDVTVTLTPSTSQTQSTSLSTSTLTFTTSNWNTAQTVTLNSAEDSDGTSGTFRISHAASGSDAKYSALSAQTLQVIVTDNDVPTAPAAPAWDPGGTTVTLSWTAPSHIGGTGATIAGYELRHKVSNTFGSWTTVTPSPATSTTVTVTPTSATQTYDYQVRAKNNSNYWGPWSAVTAAVAQAVDVPESLSLTAGNQQLTVTWSAPSNLNGLSIQLYIVNWKCGSAAASLQGASTTTSTITGLTNGVPCDVWVYALGTDGSDSSQSPSTARATATPTAG